VSKKEQTAHIKERERSTKRLKVEVEEEGKMNTNSEFLFDGH
jgi:hypothetical protein